MNLPALRIRLEAMMHWRKVVDWKSVSDAIAGSR